MAYAYDAVGNRTSETRDGQVTTSTYDDAGQLVSVGSKTYTYDADGNLLQAGSDTFAWDHEDRLTQATVGSHSATYAYDGDGVRVGATVDGVPSSYLVDTQAGLPRLVDDGSKAYLHSGGLLGEIGGGTRYALPDALGSVRGLADEAGSLVGTASYEAFGAPRTSSGASSLFGFTGEPTDATRLVYLGARTLDPTTGRFLSADSVIPNAPGTSGYNLYAYAGNDPTTWTDPTGHVATSGTGLPLSLAEAVTRILFMHGVPSAFAVVAEADVAPQGPGKFAATALLLTALVLICLVLCPALFGSGSSGGGEVVTRSDPDELRAAEDEPATPTVAPPGPWDLGGRDCPAPPGRIGPHSALSAANSGHPECQAHHIIQDRAVRDVRGYSYGRAPAIVLPTTQHALATYYQNHAPQGGTYGIERQVAIDALANAGVSEWKIDEALNAADAYFMDKLHLDYDSPTYPPRRWSP